MADRPHKSILILGGTAEANALAERLAEVGHCRVITSLAGRTTSPVLPPGEHRQGGFGGVDGLMRYLEAENVDVLVDATHPFAVRMSAHAAESAAKSGVSRIRLARPAWTRRTDDMWIAVQSEEDAADRLPTGARTFLALGRQYLHAFCRRPDVTFVIRMVDPPEHLPMENATIVLGKPSDTVAAERALFEKHEISHVVARNSGGKAGYGKIEAARTMSLPVLIIAQPPGPSGDTVASTEEAFLAVSEALR